MSEASSTRNRQTGGGSDAAGSLIWRVSSTHTMHDGPRMVLLPEAAGGRTKRKTPVNGGRLACHEGGRGAAVSCGGRGDAAGCTTVWLRSE